MAQNSTESLVNIRGVSFQQKNFQIENLVVDSIARKAFSNLTNDQKKQYTAAVARYLLLGQNRGAPLKKKEIQEQMDAEHSRAFLPILQSADKVLRDTAGLAVIEFSKGSVKHYVLSNILDVEQELYKEFVERKLEIGAQLSLLCVILSLIMMKQKAVREEELWEFLQQLSIPEGDVHHPVLGNVKKLLDEWVRQMYLEKIKEPTPDKVYFHFKWGERAIAEFSPEKIIHFIAGVHGDDPRNWLRIYQHLLPVKTDQPENAEPTNAGIASQ